jgi:hypothetical protein
VPMPCLLGDKELIPALAILMVIHIRFPLAGQIINVQNSTLLVLAGAAVTHTSIFMMGAIIGGAVSVGWMIVYELSRIGELANRYYACCRWVLVHEEYCGTVDPQPGGCDCTDCSEVVVGGYKYRDCWFGGTTAGSRHHGPTCSKWPDTEDLSHSNCGCAGYYYPFGVVGLYDHFMWEWRCN